jgi:hypothetical protein
MHDFLQRGVNDEYSASQHNQRMYVERAFNPAFPVDDSKRVLEVSQRRHQNKQHDKSQCDRNRDFQAPDDRLLTRFHPLRFNRNVEQVVKPQDRLQQNQHDKRHQVANCQESTHHRPPYTDHAYPVSATPASNPPRVSNTRKNWSRGKLQRVCRNQRVQALRIVNRKRLPVERQNMVATG